jgi:uncharacterized surface protein with fasciclin (FAS1) repeats
MNFRLVLLCFVAASAITVSFGEDDVQAEHYDDDDDHDDDHGDDDDDNHDDHYDDHIEHCESIAKFVCSNDDTDRFCDAIHYSGLYDTLDEDTYTLFAPTDSAIRKLLEAYGVSSVKEIDKDKLKDFILFHLVSHEVLYKSDLKHRCGDELEMANGKETKTTCKYGNIYQSGEGNDPDDLPKIIDFDNEACNGVVHLIDEVMLPKKRTPAPTPAPTKPRAPTPAPTRSCKSIKEIVCGDDDFEYLCKGLKWAELDDVLDDPGSFTFFAPTDDAFRNIFGSDTWRALKKLPGDALWGLLLYHVVEDHKLYYEDLKCDNRYYMANGETSKT